MSQCGQSSPVRKPPAPAPWANAQAPSVAVVVEIGMDSESGGTATVAERLTAVRARLAAVRPFPDFASKVSQLETEEKTLLEEERADRPLSRRLQSALDTLRDRESKAVKGRSSASEARAAWEAAEAHAALAETEESAARDALAKIEKDVSDAARSNAQPAMDVDTVKRALDSVVAACSAVLLPSDAVRAAALVDQLRAALNANAAAAAGATGAANTPAVDASVHAGGSGVAAARVDASEQPVVDGADTRTHAPTKRPLAAARASGRRGTSPAMASCESSGGEEGGRSRSRERRESERREAERAEQARTTRDIVDGRQRTIGDALGRGAAA
jgi:hypothetical protein